jgi:hypothetical protein
LYIYSNKAPYKGTDLRQELAIMPKKSLCISDEILFNEDGSAKPIAVSVIYSALADWKEVHVFTRRPGVCKKELGLAEAAMINGDTGYEPLGTPLNRKAKFGMKRPEHSVLLAIDCINWNGYMPSLRSVGIPK